MKDLWTCPACGERFVTPRLYHSCGRHSYEALSARSEPHVRRIFDKLATLARWMKKAYRFGVQAHLAESKTKRKGSR